MMRILSVFGRARLSSINFFIILLIMAQDISHDANNLLKFRLPISCLCLFYDRFQCVRILGPQIAQHNDLRFRQLELVQAPYQLWQTLRREAL